MVPRFNKVAGWMSAALLLAGCAGNGPQGTPPEDWRLIPESTVLGERRQFFIYGRGLDSAQVTGPKSVALEQGAVKDGGKVLGLYLKVQAIKDDSTLTGEKPGLRHIQVKTPDTSVTLSLKILNEIPR
jgi:hypothetical protein